MSSLDQADRTAEQPAEPVPLEAPLTAVGAGFDFADPHSPLAPYYCRTSHVVAALLLCLTFIAGSTFPMWHTDIWGHLKFGQWIVGHGRLPEYEPFCPWADASKPMSHFYTLSQPGLYLLYRSGEWWAGGDELRQMAGGVEFLRTTHAVLLVARLFLLLLAFRRLSQSLPLAITGLIAVLLLDLSNLAVLRPQIFGQFFFAILLLALSRPRLSSFALVGLPLLLVLWANTHGSYLVGLGLLGICLLGRGIEVWLTEERARFRAVWADSQARRLLGTILVALVGIAFINPHGPSFYLRTLEMGRHPGLLTSVSEWQPLALSDWHWPFLISLAAACLTQYFSPRPFTPTQLLLLVIFGVGVACQMRMVIWWAMIVPWALVPHWAAIRERYFASWPRVFSVPCLRKTVVVVLLLFAALMWSGPVYLLINGQPRPLQGAVSGGTPWQLGHQLRHPDDPKAQWLPALGEVLRKHYPQGQFTGAIMATPMQGDYLLWDLAPEVPVTYAHMHLFPAEFLEELGTVSRGETGWWDILNRHRVNLLVVEAEWGGQLREQLRKDPAWQIVLDETGDRRKPQPLNRQLIAVRVQPL